ncbi:GntR family transcriptional regulator [Azospirillum sp. ST 5-10]|uniref:GntR family transcriptional regulator n=1 Tax=unclassified Azospirillum TaxID=2630922 RepID=UPI003F4A6247
MIRPTTSVPEDPGHRARGSLADRAYAIIRRDIVSWTLKPGDAFTEMDVAARLAMSKTPVREALMRLQFDGLVKAYPRRGYVVEPIKVSHINDIFDLRVILERGATELAVARADPEELDRLAELAAAIPYERYHADAERARDVNDAFHEGIALASRNERLHRTLAQLLKEMERFFHIEAQAPQPRTEAYATHRDIVEAMRRGEAAAAGDAMVDHIEGTRRVLLASVFDANRRLPLLL